MINRSLIKELNRQVVQVQLRKTSQSQVTANTLATSARFHMHFKQCSII